MRGVRGMAIGSGGVPLNSGCWGVGELGVEYGGQVKSALRRSRTGAIPDPGCLIGCKTRAQLIARYAFAPLELRQAPLDLSVDGRFVLLKTDFALTLYCQGVEEHVF